MNFSENSLKCEFEKLRDEFLKHPTIDVQDKVDRLASDFLNANVCDVDVLVEMMSSEGIYRHRDLLVEHKAKIDYCRMLQNLSPQLIAEQVDKLLRWGCDPDDLVDDMSVKDIELNILQLMHNGASAEKLINRLNDEGEKNFLFWNRELFEAYYDASCLAFPKNPLQSATA